MIDAADPGRIVREVVQTCNIIFDQAFIYFDLTLSGPAFSVVRQARGGGGGGLRGPDAKNQS